MRLAGAAGWPLLSWAPSLHTSGLLLLMPPCLLSVAEVAVPWAHQAMLAMAPCVEAAAPALQAGAGVLAAENLVLWIANHGVHVIEDLTCLSSLALEKSVLRASP